MTFAQQYAPAAGELGTTAMKADSSAFVAWATNVEVIRGFIDISDTNITFGTSNRATTGKPENAVGQVNGALVSLGDSGVAIITFAKPITNGPGNDFAVFENGFITLENNIEKSFLELAHVEVSSDGINYVRFPSHSETQTDNQVGPYMTIDAKYLNNLAGKYTSGYGTPFDLEELKDSANLNVNQITHVKLIDVVGSIGPEGSIDSYGNKINDPFPTPFSSSGFDLDAVGVIHQNNSADLVVESLDFNVYPNPSKGLINIEMSHTNADELFITNSLGKIVKEEFSISINSTIQFELPQGIYFIHLKNKDRISSRKVIVH